MGTRPTQNDPPDICVGQGVIELLSSAMYIDPLTLFREYIQNAVDAIDEAVTNNQLASYQDGRIDITLDQHARRIVIRDNGCGLNNTEFAMTMLTIGDSPKRGTFARGFRGVGRLAGLGYAQQVIFRSRSVGDPDVMEVLWDGRTLKQLLAANTHNGNLETLIQQTVTVTSRPADEAPPHHFFEVELVKPRRIVNDTLMNEIEIAAYLGQVAPCPFAPEFSHGAEISNLLGSYGHANRTYAIHITAADTPLYRPYRDTLPQSATLTNTLQTLVPFTIAGLDGDPAAIGWRVHHEYQGALPAKAGIRGVRARIGNMQVGGERLLADMFPEDRFCAWSIGEIHILDPRVVPNGRRDAFEGNIHLDNILHHLRPIGADIARHCRVSSQKRNRLKTFMAAESKIHDTLGILRQGAVSAHFAQTAQAEIGTLLAAMRKAADFSIFDTKEEQDTLTRQLTEIEAKVAWEERSYESTPFAHRPAKMRQAYQEMIDLIYACSTNPATAKVLVDRILERL